MTAFQQVIVEDLSEHGQESSHVERLMVEEAPNNEQMFRESPRDSQKELRQNKPPLSTCFTEQAH